MASQGLINRPAFSLVSPHSPAAYYTFVSIQVLGSYWSRYVFIIEKNQERVQLGECHTSCIFFPFFYFFIIFLLHSFLPPRAHTRYLER